MTGIQRVRVPLGFLFGLVYLYLSRPQPLWMILGMTLAMLGLLLRFWASGYLEKGKILAKNGPYAHTRNPLYLGSFLMGLGITVAGSVLWLVATYLVLFLVVYHPVMRREERELQDSFGDLFEAYRSQVPLFLPRLHSSPGVSSDNTAICNFMVRRAIINGEHRTIVGFLMISALVVLKMLWK